MSGKLRLKCPEIHGGRNRGQICFDLSIVIWNITPRDILSTYETMRQRRSTKERDARPVSKKRAVSKKLASNRARRGRPHKFGRPAHVVTLTLPEDVLEALRSVHRDPGWAIVQLVEPMLGNGVRSERSALPKPAAELVRLSGRRSLIVVQPEVFAGLPGVSTIKLADGGAFLAFDHDAGPAELELALMDRLDKESTKGTRRAQLTQARNIVRAWRQNAGLVFRTKSIIVVEGAVEADPGPLASVQREEFSAEGEGREDDARQSHGRPPVG